MEQNQQIQPPVFNPQTPQQPAAPQYQPRVTARPMMDPVEAVKTCFKKYFDFKGRARRSEFWWFMLFVLIVSTALSYLGLVIPGVGYVSMVVSLALLIPELSVLCRRLHDTNHGSWWVVVMALLLAGYYGSLGTMLGSNFESIANISNPEEMMSVAEAMADSIQASPGLATAALCCGVALLIVGIILFIFTLLDSKWGENKYGPSPKYQ